MKQKVEEFIAILLSIGIRGTQLGIKSYEYALALQADEQSTGAHVSATMMVNAAELARDARPGAWNIYAARGYMALNEEKGQ